MLSRSKKTSRSTSGLVSDDKSQSRAFIAKAREIGMDENASASDQLLGRLAKMKPEPRAKKE
jgi:hypothetical protein